MHTSPQFEQDLIEKFRHLTERKSVNQRLAAARDMIETQYDTELNVDELAEQAFLSRATFINRFRKLYRHTPYQYLIKCRLEAATYLLRNSSLSISYITAATGFRSRSTFGRLFAERYRLSPSRFRCGERVAVKSV